MRPRSDGPKAPRSRWGRSEVHKRGPQLYGALGDNHFGPSKVGPLGDCFLWCLELVHQVLCLFRSSVGRSLPRTTPPGRKGSWRIFRRSRWRPKMLDRGREGRGACCIVPR